MPLTEKDLPYLFQRAYMRTLQTQPVLSGDIFHIIMHEQGSPLRREEFWVVWSRWGGCMESSPSLTLLVLLWKNTNSVCKNCGRVLWGTRWIQAHDSPWDLSTWYWACKQVTRPSTMMKRCYSHGGGCHSGGYCWGRPFGCFSKDRG